MIINFIRSLIFNILFFGSTICLLILAIPAAFMGKKVLRFFLYIWLSTTYFLEKYILGLNYVVKGFENLPQKGAYIIAAKHQSAWETMKLHILFNDPAVILKKSLMDIPLWGRCARVMGMIPVDRSRGSEALKNMLKHAKRVVDEEQRPIVIFPQGTRVAVGENKKYKIGMIRLYEELNIPLIPVALNSGLFWPRNSFIKKPGQITVEILTPIQPGKDGQKVFKQVQEQIENTSSQLSQTALIDHEKK